MWALYLPHILNCPTLALVSRLIVCGSNAPVRFSLDPINRNEFLQQKISLFCLSSRRTYGMSLNIKEFLLLMFMWLRARSDLA